MNEKKISELIEKIKAASSITERRTLRAELRNARRPAAAKVRRTEPPERTVDPGQDPDHEAPRKPVMVGNDDVSAWPAELRRKVVGGPWGRTVGM